MKKLKTPVLIATVCLIGIGIVLASRSSTYDAVSRSNGDAGGPSGLPAIVPKATPDAVTQSADIPDNVVYGIMFRQIAAFNSKADEIEKNGGDGGPLRTHFARVAGLNDSESSLLDSVVADFMREASLIDARQKEMVAAFYRQHPDGQIQRGEARERPPAYHELNLERDRLYLRMRDQLNTVLSAETFTRLDGAIRSKVAGNPKSILGATSPAATQAEQEKP